ncbi:GNAT family N-acetyltransferase [Leifsonia xyli]|uniref:GNAT family N-acetyltransferase n=1 Tax=Leifsonia xyli TaxID=1575 RepID=UPI003D66C5C4
MNLEIRERHNRFVAFLNGSPVAVVPYRRRGDQVIVEATRTKAAEWRSDVAGRVFEEVLRTLQARGERVHIECPLITEYLRAHGQTSGDVEISGVTP